MSFRTDNLRVLGQIISTVLGEDDNGGQHGDAARTRIEVS